MTQAVAGGITTTFTYNGDGLRVGKSVAGGADNSPMVWDVGLALPLLISDSTYVYIYGVGPIGMVDAGGNAYYYLRDGLGSVTGLVDSSGTLTATYSYDAYGNLRSSTGTIANAFRYTGEWYDSETGLYYLRARYYDPAVGRFVSRDPWKGVVERPYSQNLYLYVENDPVGWADPSGECGPECAVMASPAIWVAAALALTVFVYDLQHPDQIRAAGQACASAVDILLDWFAKRTTEGRNPAQDKSLTKDDLKKLEKVGGAEAIKEEIIGPRNAGKYDLYKDQKGNVIMKPKGGRGPGEPTVYNLNDL